MIIKKIFDGQVDEEVHSAFLKFGKGEFRNKYLIEAKLQGGGKWSIKTGQEFANFFVRKCLEKVNGSVAVKGVIICTFDLSKELNFEIKKKSNFQGIRKIAIETEVDAREILDLMDKYPRVFFALSFVVGDCILKIKAKAPKSGKPGKDGEGPVADFCSLKTTDKSIVDELLFDVRGGWKEVKINHTLKIEDIVYPENFKDMKPEEVREQSKRKGVVVRKVDVDGVVKESEEEFEA